MLFWLEMLTRWKLIRNCQMIWLVLVLAMCLSCGGPVMETKLNGFDQGKRTLKLNYILNDTTLEDGRKGFKLDTLVHYAVGTKVNHKTERESFLNEDFSLVRTTSTARQNENLARTSAEVKGGKIHVHREASGKEDLDVELDHIGPIYIEMHPLLYYRDLTKPGQSKTYPILNDEEGQIASVEIRYVGETQFYEDNVAHDARHYQIQAVTKPDEYDDYYLDPKTGNIIKIEFGYIKFVPAK